MPARATAADDLEDLPSTELGRALGTPEGVFRNLGDRLEGAYSHTAWVERHQLQVMAYARRRWHRRERRGRLADLVRDNPAKVRALVMDARRRNEDKAAAVVNYFRDRESIICLMVGKRGGGKSISAGWLTKIIHEQDDRRVCTLGLQRYIPDYMTRIVDMREAEPGDLVIVDEGAEMFSHRKWNRKGGRDLPGFLATARHKGLTVLALVQNSSITDNVIMKLSDALWFKETSLNQEVSERGRIRSIIHEFDEMLPEDVSGNFILTDKLPPMTWVAPRPPWWEYRYSKANLPYDAPEDVVPLAARLHKYGWDWPPIADLTASVLQHPMPPTWWREMVEDITPTDLDGPPVGQDPDLDRVIAGDF